MYTEPVEIYSDRSNAVVMRHPRRRFPGVLIQGDSLFTMWRSVDNACKAAVGVLPEDEYEELNDLRNHLRSLLDHYKQILTEHQIEMPFFEASNGYC